MHQLIHARGSLCRYRSRIHHCGIQYIRDDDRLVILVLPCSCTTTDYRALLPPVPRSGRVDATLRPTATDYGRDLPRKQRSRIENVRLQTSKYSEFVCRHATHHRDVCVQSRSLRNHGGLKKHSMIRVHLAGREGKGREGRATNLIGPQENSRPGPTEARGRRSPFH